MVLPVQREQLRHTASSVSVHGENSHSVLSAAHAVHDEQTRPLLLVGGTDSNVFSGTHSSRGSQTRSFSGDGAMLSNSDVALQGSECGAHTRSLLAVGADVWYLPAKQADTSAQKRLLDAVGAAVSYWLAPHTRTPAHRRSLNAVRSVTMNWLSVHTVAGVHTRWVVGVGAFDCHSSALHTRSAVHALSDVAVGSVDAYSVAASQRVRGEHIRSDNAVGAVVCCLLLCSLLRILGVLCAPHGPCRNAVDNGRMVCMGGSAAEESDSSKPTPRPGLRPAGSPRPSLIGLQSIRR